MPVAYDPLNFWGVLFTPGGMVRMIPRATLLMPFAIGAASLEEWGPEGTKIFYSSLDSMTIPFTMLVGLLTSFRVNDAFNKWKGAAKSVDMLHAFSKEVITRLCAFCEPTAENLASVVEIRRLMVLGVVLLQKHVRGLDDFELELKSGLITAEELQQLTKDKLSICVTSGKKDRFPSKNRPAFAYMKCHQATMASGLVDAAMARRKAFPAPPYHTSIDAAMLKMNAVFDDVENLARTQIPLPYAQIARFVCFLFLASLRVQHVLLPFALVSKLKWFVIPTSFLSNIVYFTIDDCAAEMETPFGEDENDVDIDKLTRRIDKHTAAMVGLWSGKPALNYDVFPDTNSQHASRLGRVDTLYRVASSKDYSKSKGLGPAEEKSPAKTPAKSQSKESSGGPPTSAGPSTIIAVDTIQMEAAAIASGDEPERKTNELGDAKKDGDGDGVDDDDGGGDDDAGDE